MSASSRTAVSGRNRPDASGGPLERWCQAMTRALGDTLQALVLYGGLAKDEFVAGHSDVNVAVVLRRGDLPVLDRLAPLVQQGALEFRLAALVLTEADVRDLAEVFPIKFLDMQRHHRLLAGEDPLVKIAVPRPQLVRRCEQELRNQLLRLRHAYVTQTQRPEWLQSTLSHAVSSLLLNLGVLAELQGGQRADTKEAALELAGSLGLPHEPLRQAWALKRGELRLDALGLQRLYGAFLDAVQQAAEQAGRLTGGGSDERLGG